MSTDHLRAFISPSEDDPTEYVKPLKEYLLTEGDLKGDLAATEEHLKKLKFTYIELLTKELFLGHVASGGVDSEAFSVGRSNELDETLAKAKRSAKKSMANLASLQNAVSETACPQLGYQWEALDKTRQKYVSDLEWLDHSRSGANDGKVLAHPAALLAAKTDVVDQQYNIEQLAAEHQRLASQIAGRQLENNELAATAAKLKGDIAELEQRAGGRSMRDGFAKDEMTRW